MSDAVLTGSVSVAGVVVNLGATRSAEGTIGQDVTLAKAWDGDLTTRTNATDGIITTDSTHDILVTDFIWIFWTLAGVAKVAYYADVSAVTGTTITFDTALGSDGDSGNALPLVNQSCIVAAGTEINIDFDGDDVGVIAASMDALGHLRFMDVGPVELHEQDLIANEGWFWISDMGWTNLLTGNPVDAIWAAQGGVSVDGTLKLGVLYDSA